EEEINKVAAIIDRYILLIGNIASQESRKEQKKLTKWFVDVASCEIEEELSPNPKNQALIECMYRSINENFVTKEKSLSVEEKNIQVYIAIQRALVKADQPMIEYSLLKLYYPTWQELNLNNIRKIRKELVGVRDRIDGHIKHPLSRYFLVQMQKYNPLFIILRDVLEEGEEQASGVVADVEEFENAVEKACNEEYQQTNARLKRSIIRSLIYIFMTKMLLALVVEVPFDEYFLGALDWTPIIVNVIFHPILLAVLVLTARKPGKDNTEKIIQGLKEIVYGYEEEGGPIEIKRDPKKRGAAQLIFNILYATTFVVSFGAIIFILNNLMHFNVVSILLFLLFLSIVSFFGIKIRHTSKELMVIDRKENVVSFVFDLMVLPIVRAGRFISLNFSRINVFVFIMDVIIEAPFKSLIEIFEQWLTFLREKKEEVFRES
ncbi:hypothetical protein KKC60_00155, partial [Patescibacteria group bacterium]|nr:hypothetical protein [Patescibacteria group bacterium]